MIRKSTKLSSLRARRIGYLGPPGSFCDEACRRYTKGKKQCKLIWYGTIYDTLLALQDGFLDACVVPIENAIEGTVGMTTDFLAKQEVLKIQHELILPIEQYLLGKRGQKLGEITDLLSHPQALAQCQAYIRMMLPGVTLHHADSTSEAVRLVSQKKPGRKSFAAIGTLRAAALYELAKLSRQNISDFEENETRFVVVGREDHPPTGHDKTSIMFTTLRDKPGALYEILGEFAKRKINLTKIESRPSKKVLGDYQFFIDLAGHRQTPKVQAALESVRRRASSLCLLGSYPVASH